MGRSLGIVGGPREEARGLIGHRDSHKRQAPSHKQQPKQPKHNEGSVACTVQGRGETAQGVNWEAKWCVQNDERMERWDWGNIGQLQKHRKLQKHFKILGKHYRYILETFQEYFENISKKKENHCFSIK